MTKEEKKLAVVSILDETKHIVLEGIDLGADEDLQPYELLSLTLTLMYQRDYMEAALMEQIKDVFKKEPQLFEEKKEITETPKTNVVSLKNKKKETTH